MTKDYTINPEKKTTIRARNSTILELRKLEISRREPSEEIILRLIENYNDNPRNNIQIH